METAVPLYLLAGCNRGGKTNTRLLLEEKIDFPMKVKLIDAEANRAEALVPLYQKKGIEVLAEQKTAEESLDFPVDIRVMAIDNPKSLIRVFESSNQKLLQFGALLVSDDTPIGGMVLGFGGSFIADAPEEIRSQAKTLLNLIDQLTGTRRSSSGISQDWLNAIQVEPTRELVHQELVRDAYQFMKNQTLSSRLFVTETLLPIGPHVYQLELINWDNPRSTNRQLAQVAKEKVKDLPCQQGQARAIGFVQNIADQPTLKLVTLRKNGKWVIRDRSIQFPSPIEFRISRFAEQPKIADQSKNDPSSVSDFSNFDSPSSNQVYMTD